IQIPTKLGSSAKGNPRQTVTLNFNLGWNMFSLPMETGKTASDVCNELGPDAIGVAKWDNPSVAYTLYICDSPGNTPDFIIDPYVGYAALIPTARIWTVTGGLENQNLELEEGWTFTGFK